MVKVYQRETGKVIEPMVYQDQWVRRLYCTRWGRWLLPVVTHPLLSSCLSWLDHTPLSYKKVKDFIQTYQIDMSEFQPLKNASFASFFTRQLKAGVCEICEERAVLAVADSCLQVFSVDEALQLTIKGQTYSLPQLLEDAQLAQQFVNGCVCVYRLSVEDYHRYLVCESGVIVKRQRIRGKLHTVRALAQRIVPVYKENKREYCVIQTELGPVVQMEIGALLVGKIHNTSATTVQHGQEKGYFDLGGSTIVVIYPANTIEIDEDIQLYSKQGIETRVKLGEKVGHKNVK